jgi:hypothetical protein
MTRLCIGLADVSNRENIFKRLVPRIPKRFAEFFLFAVMHSQYGPITSRLKTGGAVIGRTLNIKPVEIFTPEWNSETIIWSLWLELIWRGFGLTIISYYVKDPQQRAGSQSPQMQLHAEDGIKGVVLGWVF